MHRAETGRRATTLHDRNTLAPTLDAIAAQIREGAQAAATAASCRTHPL